MSQQPGRAPAWGYQPALDGIRALAVTAVLLFHAGVGALAGGFLGVDAFFVLSGFLITSLLLTEHLRDGRIDLVRFWTRRARRLLPALLATVLATVVTAGLVLDRDALGLLRADAYAALGYVANWRMIFRGTGYVAATATPSPLQHTWSLAIEEQFYLLWPLIVAGLLARFALRRSRALLLVLCAAGIAGSQLLCDRLFQVSAIGRAYYGTDTRAQALLIGAASAVLLRPAARHTPFRYAVAGALGLPAAVATLWFWHYASEQAGWLYRGGLTGAAVAAALVVGHVVVRPRSPLARLLSLPPLVGLGRISYGVYLWHWPLFTFVTAEATGLSRWPLLAVRLAGTLAVAVVSYHLIEQPIRRGVLGRRLPRRVPAVATGAAFGVVTAAIGWTTTVPPESATAAAPPVVIPTVAAPVPKPAGPVAPIDRPGRPRSAGREPRVTFLGDSVAWTIGAYLPAHPGMWTSVRAVQGCGIATLPDLRQLDSPHTNYPGCTSWAQRWQRGIDRDDPDVAVIGLNRWELMDRRYQGRYQHVGEPAYDGYLSAQLDRAVRVAGSRGAAVVLLTAAYTRRAERPDGSLYPEDRPERVDAWNRLLHAAADRHPGRVTVLDLNPVVCPGGRFTWRVGGVRVRGDGLHYTPAGVQRIIAPWLLPRLAAVATGTPATHPAPGSARHTRPTS
ncbi:acyltransferase family protein [Actinoplanes teichomyceticus]|uniref:Peptidoglycan/LPS O-acetylase OafA/YrhL n=1 Tax=Actinoplanes teichomyceticus TaxID=1867 RepID=A0A561WBC7_ACTTI|nr:acyltransferase family protein [Actinoplanes teichomyceticus]TWG21153.1 peptidoglycan/LPS O-acetylase OafA/YrhL [Actinoplanes teichomyceticus]GIF14975.1 acyltransferase [Actinoplanes teichomyceticus]